MVDWSVACLPGDETVALSVVTHRLTTVAGALWSVSETSRKLDNRLTLLPPDDVASSCAHRRAVIDLW